MSSMDVSLRKLWVLVMDRESWPAEVHGVPKIQTWLTELNTLKGFSIVSETVVDVFLSFPCFLYDPANVSNLISGVSAFFKPRLDVWKFLVHIMLTSRMQDFNHDLTSMGDECNCPMVSTFFSTTLLGNWDEDWPFSVQWSSRFADVLKGIFW